MNNQKTAALTTLGCKLNTYETKGMAAVLRRRGYREVPFGEPADLYVINTCTVTARADQSSRNAVRRALRTNPRARVVVVGCAAQRDPEMFTAIPGVHYVLGNREKNRFHEVVDQIDGPPPENPRVLVGPMDADSPFEDLALRDFPGYTRAFIKIQEGCDFACTFCIIPAVRGKSRSMPVEQVVQRIRDLSAQGFDEVVLTGVLMGSYGRDFRPRLEFADLLEVILRETSIAKIRLSSLLPIEISERLVDLVASEPRLCKHLHIPLQSGDDQILRAMRRPYKRARYRALVEELARRVPHIGLGADVIVGFPGEEDEHFARTMQFIEELPLTYLHVFSYSNREGTRASTLSGQTPADVIQRRSRLLRQLGRDKAAAFRRSLIGTVQDAIALDERDAASGRQKALTHNYVQVLLETDMTPGLARVALERIDDGGRAVVGRAVDSPSGEGPRPATHPIAS